jgi:SAM-dependent methyltransferase
MRWIMKSPEENPARLSNHGNSPRPEPVIRRARTAAKAIARAALGARLYELMSAIYHLPHDRKPFLRHVLGRTEFLTETEIVDASLLPEVLLENVLRTFRPGSVLDVGCGVGRSLDWFAERGCEVLGLEASGLAIEKARRPGQILKHNLEKKLELRRRFDLCWCFEVAEHIRPNFASALVETMTRHSDLIVMSAAHPGQGGYGHVNEQPREYWIRLLKSHGYGCGEDVTSRITRGVTWNPQNVFVFQREAVRDCAGGQALELGSGRDAGVHG